MQSVLKRSCQSNDSGRGLRPCDVTLRSARFEKEIKILLDKKKKNTQGGFVTIESLCTHCQHAFQFKLVVKVYMTPLTEIIPFKY